MQHTAIHFLKMALFHPASPAEFAISAALGAFAFVYTLNLVGSALNMSLAQSGRSTVVLIVGLVTNLLTLSLLDLNFSPSGWVLIAAGVGVTLVVVVPFTCFLHKGSYSTALISLVLAVTALLVAALLVHTVFGAISGGTQSVGEGLRYNRELEQAIEGP